MKTTRHYSLPSDLIERVRKEPISRSAVLTLSILKTRDNPFLIPKAVEHRLREGVDESETGRVTVSIDPEIVKMLDELAGKVRLPVEHVLRLSIEAYVHRL